MFLTWWGLRRHYMPRQATWDDFLPLTRREERFVCRDERTLPGRHFVARKDRVGRAGGNARAAIDALGGIDVHLRRLLKARFVAFRMDAVNGTGLDAQLVFDAVVGDHVCHDAAPEREFVSQRC